MLLSFQKKKTLGLERKEAKMEKEEAEKYQKLQDNLADRQVTYVFRLNLIVMSWPRKTVQLKLKLCFNAITLTIFPDLFFI